MLIQIPSYIWVDDFEDEYNLNNSNFREDWYKSVSSDVIWLYSMKQLEWVLKCLYD